MRSKHRYSVAVTTTLTEICDVQCCAIWQCQGKYGVTILTATCVPLCEYHKWGMEMLLVVLGLARHSPSSAKNFLASSASL